MQLKNLAFGVFVAVPLAEMAQIPANPDPRQPDFRVDVQGTFDA
jgi:hypothetical protein